MDSVKAREVLNEGKPIKTNLLEFSANKEKREEFEKEKLAMKKEAEKSQSGKLNFSLSGT